MQDCLVRNTNWLQSLRIEHLESRVICAVAECLDAWLGHLLLLAARRRQAGKVNIQRDADVDLVGNTLWNGLKDRLRLLEERHAWVIFSSKGDLSTVSCSLYPSDEAIAGQSGVVCDADSRLLWCRSMYLETMNLGKIVEPVAHTIGGLFLCLNIARA